MPFDDDVSASGYSSLVSEPHCQGAAHPLSSFILSLFFVLRSGAPQSAHPGSTIMKRPRRDPVREDRIYNEAIVGARPEEQATSLMG
jgi:hypothetical protein